MDPSSPASNCPNGDSEITEPAREYDWSTTPLGSLETWPDALRLAVEAAVATGRPERGEGVPAPPLTMDAVNAFLVRFADMVLEAPEPQEIAQLACQLVAETLGVERVYWAEVDWATREYVIGAAVHQPGVPVIAGRFPIDAWEPFTSYHLSGRSVVVDDTQADERVPPEMRAAYAQMAIGADLATPVAVNGQLRCTLAVNQQLPRHWTEAEVALIRGVARRCWAAVDRARAGVTLGEAEARYRTLFAEMADGYARYQVMADTAGVPRDLRILEVNPAYERLMQRPNPAGKQVSELEPALEQEWIDALAHVVRSETPQRFERYNATLERWFDVHVTPVAADVAEVVLVFSDITERKQAEEALRERDARRALLIDITGDLDRLAGEEDIIRTVGARLVDHLGLTGYQYVDVDDASAEATVRYTWHALEVPSVLGTYPISGFVTQDGLEHLRTGEPFVINDVAGLPGDDPAVARLKAGAAAQKIGAYVAVPYSRDGRWKAYFAAVDSTPRRWTPAEVELIQEVAGRVMPRVERARAERRAEGILERMGDAQCVLDHAFRFVSVNAATERLLGRSREELLGRSHWEAFPASVDAPVGRAFRRVVAEGVEQHLTHHYTGEGYNLHLELDAYPTDEGGVAMFWRDVTERVRAEEALRQSEERYRTLFESMDQGFCIIEKLATAPDAPSNFRYLTTNPAFRRHTHLPDPAGTTILELVPDAEPEIMAHYDRVLATGKPEQFEAYVAAIDLWMATEVNPTPEPGQLAVLFTDITERKRTEEALRESEAQFRTFAEFATDTLWIADAESGRLEYISPAFERMWGESRDAVIADLDRWIALLHPEDRAEASLGMRRVVTGEVPRLVKEYRIIRPTDGATRWILDTGFAIHDDAGVMTRVGGIAQDITARKMAEMALRESEERLRRMVNTPGVGVLVFNEQGTLLEANDAFLAMTGYDRATVQDGRLDWRMMTPPEYVAASEQQMAQLAETGRIGPYEKEYLHPDGSRSWMMFACAALGDGAIVEYCIDISDRKRAEAALRESEARIQKALSIETVGVIFFTLDGGITDANAALARMTGYSRDELRAMGDWGGLTPPEFQEATERAEGELATRGETAPYEKQCVRKDGSRFWGLFAPTRLSGAGQQAECVEFVVDITELKRAEVRLREGEERQRFLLRLSDALRPLADPNAVQVAAARLLGEHLGVDRTTYIEIGDGGDPDAGVVRGQYARPGVAPFPERYSYAALVHGALGQALQAGEPLVVTDAASDARLGESERSAWLGAGIRALVAQALEKGGGVVAIFGLHHGAPRAWTETEIALVREVAERTWAAVERNRAEAALRASEARLVTLVENLPDYAIFLVNPAGIVTEWTEGAERVKGYAPEEIVGQPFAVFYTPEDQTARLPAHELAEAARTGRYEGEGWRVRQSGERFWANEIATAVRDEAGQLIGFTKISRDLTKRMQADAALRQSEERYRRIVEQAADYAIFTVDADRCIETWPPGAERVFGWTAEEAIGQLMDITFTPEDRAAGVPQAEVQQARERGFAPNVRWHQRQDGARVFIEGTTYVRTSEDGTFLGVFKVGQDVTAPRATLEALRQSEAMLATVLQAAPVAVGFFDTNGHVRLANPAMRRYLPNGIIPSREPARVDRWVAYDADGQRVAPADFPGSQALRGVAIVPGLEMRYRPDDGPEVWARVSALPLRNEQGQVTGQVAVITDIDELKRTAETLRQSEASLQERVAAATIELRTLSRRLLSVQEEERRKLALELHDEIGQVLTGLAFQLASAAGTGGAPSLASAQQTLSDLTEQVRQLALDLRPQVLDRYGVLAALQWYVERYHATTGITVHLRHEGMARRFTPEVEIAAFRVVQEALTNVARYAGVAEVWVTLFSDESLLVVIHDQGRGFDPEQLHDSSGLGGMRERVELLGGSFDLETAPRAGVAITAEFPLVDVDPDGTAENMS